MEILLNKVVESDQVESDQVESDVIVCETITHKRRVMRPKQAP